MADWIDALASKLTDEQRLKNEQRRLSLLEADLIDAKGPSLFAETMAHAENLAYELDAKLGASIGAVTFQVNGSTGFVVRNAGAVVQVALTVRLDAKGRQVKTETQRSGSTRHIDPGAVRDLPFIVLHGREVGVRFDKGDNVFDGDVLANRLLKEAFTDAVLTPF